MVLGFVRRARKEKEAYEGASLGPSDGEKRVRWFPAYEWTGCSQSTSRGGKMKASWKGGTTCLFLQGGETVIVFEGKKPPQKIESLRKVGPGGIGGTCKSLGNKGGTGHYRLFFKKGKKGNGKCDLTP